MGAECALCFEFCFLGKEQILNFYCNLKWLSCSQWDRIYIDPIRNVIFNDLFIECAVHECTRTCLLIFLLLFFHLEFYRLQLQERIHIIHHDVSYSNSFYCYNPLGLSPFLLWWGDAGMRGRQGTSLRMQDQEHVKVNREKGWQEVSWWSFSLQRFPGQIVSWRRSLTTSEGELFLVLGV